MNTMNVLVPLFGGLLIGLAALLLLLTHGKVAGISGMLGGLAGGRPDGLAWRAAFLGGLVAGGVVMQLSGVLVFSPLLNRSAGAVLAAGLLVGLGTQIGSGCTSGHGVCGLGRFSKRSLVATLTFMVTGALTVYVINHVLRGPV